VRVLPCHGPGVGSTGEWGSRATVPAGRLPIVPSAMYKQAIIALLSTARARGGLLGVSDCPLCRAGPNAFEASGLPPVPPRGQDAEPIEVDEDEDEDWDEVVAELGNPWDMRPGRGARR
jgi:hypothetical protein